MKNKKISAGLLLVALAISMCASAQAANTKEEDIRSAIIVAMLRFTTWQNSEIAGKDSLELCSYGSPLSQNRIDRGIKQAPFFGKKLSHRELISLDMVDSCDVLILGPESDQAIAAVTLNNKLSICDGCTANKNSVVAALELIDDSIKFNINLYRANSAGIKLSSDLLILANEIKRKPDNV